ncbi:MAG: restriction endonuclease subunit S, partial [Anaerolineales bacterium]
LEIPLPPRPIQQEIATILSAYDDLIENNTRRIKILEEMAQAIYREWFVKFRFPGHEKVKMTDSPLGSIPEGWEVVRLGDIAEDVRRGIPKGNLEEPMPYVGLEHIPRKSLALSNWEIVEELGSNKLIFERGEVLFGKIRPYFHKVSVAPFRGICSADTIVIRSISEGYAALVTACVSSEHFVAHATATSNGAKMPRANWKVLIEYQVLKPASDLLNKFSIFFNTVIEEQQNLVRRNNILRQSRDLLLPRLISGKLNVSELEIAIGQEAT